MKTLSLLLCIFFTAGNLFSQKDSSLPANQIKISPLRIIDFYNPGYELSYERLNGKRFSTQLSLAYMTKTVLNIPFKNIRGYRIGLEEKYFVKRRKTDGSYFSTDAVAYHVLFDKEIVGQKQSATDSSVFTDFKGTSSFRKYTLTFNAKFGLQTYMSRHLMMDVCFGLGVRYFHVEILSVPDGIIYQPGSKSPLPNIYDLISEPGSYVTINIPFNLKIGYTF